MLSKYQRREKQKGRQIPKGGPEASQDGLRPGEAMPTLTIPVHPHGRGSDVSGDGEVRNPQILQQRSPNVTKFL